MELFKTFNVTYDVRGRLTQQNWIVPGTGGGTFRLDHTYNAADQATTLRYPGGAAGQQASWSQPATTRWAR